MSLIGTHHDLLISERRMVMPEAASIMSLTTKIAFEIVQAHPGLIADVEAGRVSDRILKTEIIKLIDDLNLHHERQELIRHVMDYMFGYGVLQSLVEDDDISDIDMPRYDYCMIKRNGQKEIYPLAFLNEQEFDRFCRLIIIRNGGVINENDAHARVSDTYYKMRINVTIPPRSATGPTLCVRKHRQEAYNLEDLCVLEMFDYKVKAFLKTLMADNSRFLISGKGAAGKTTLLRALLACIDEKERIMVCEKDMELHLTEVNFVVQRIKKAGNRASESLKGLMQDGLTMSLDGYCIGEIIGEEAWEFVKAGHTDHRVFGTIHANSPEDVLERLLMLIAPATALSEKRIQQLIFESVDYIIHMERFKLKSVVALRRKEDKMWLEQII